MLNTNTTNLDSQLAKSFDHTDVDRRAWELAKIALGPNASLTSVVERSQTIKLTLLAEVK